MIRSHFNYDADDLDAALAFISHDGMPLGSPPLVRTQHTALHMMQTHLPADDDDLCCLVTIYAVSWGGTLCDVIYRTDDDGLQCRGTVMRQGDAAPLVFFTFAPSD